MRVQAEGHDRTLKLYPDTIEQKLGFDVVRERLESLLLSPLGRDALEEMRPTGAAEEVRHRLNQVEELQNALRFDDAVPLSGIVDVRESVARAAPRGAALSAEELTHVQVFAGACRRFRAFFQTRREKYPTLWADVGFLQLTRVLEDRIAEVLDEEGRIRDSASPALRHIRREIVRQQQQLRRVVLSAMRDAVSQGYSTEDQPTIRSGRMVIPVRAEAKRKVQGFIHDTSATGQTVYVEPTSCLELNNEVRSLEIEEQREVYRILQEATNLVRAAAADLTENAVIMGRIDLLQAKARLSNRLGSEKPVIRDDPAVRIRHGRNPALVLIAGEAAESGSAKSREVVPLDLELGIDFHVLVITGPNAGGKSVAMKTVGLFALMLSYGLPIPAGAGTEFGVFEKLLVDLGDEQSIEDDLSTFGSHVTNLRFMLASADRRTLVLIDEAGTGTDPAEGSALAQAALERLVAREARVIATTHHGALKVFAHETPGVANASLQFDRESLRPTYRFQEGVPGASFAFDVASRMGLDGGLLDRARELAGTGQVAFEQMLAELSQQRKASEDLLSDLRTRSASIEEERRLLSDARERLDAQVDEIRERALAEAEDLVRKANARIERTIREIKESGAEREATRAAREELQSFKSQLDERATRTRAAARARTRSRPAKSSGGSGAGKSSVIAVGDRVRVDDSDLEAEVLELHGSEAVVARGSVRARVALERLTRVGGRAKQQVVVRSSRPVGDAPSMRASLSIDVRGKRVDEVLPIVTRFVDDGVAAGLDRLEILHGTGTGALRAAIRDMLAASQDVASFADAPWDQGGPGVTVIRLK